MDKKTRSPGASGKAVQAHASLPVTADSLKAGTGSQGDFFHINDQGEYCFGTKCFSMRVKPGAGEIRVIVDRNECGTDAQQLVDTLFAEVVKGAPTVYETVSKVKE